MPSPVSEVIASVLITLLLTGLGVYYAIRESFEFKGQSGFWNSPPADRRHFRAQFFRRITGSAMLFATGMVVFVNQVILDWERTPKLYLALWTCAICGLLGIVCLAGVDLLSIRRYARRHSERLASDRREMIHRQMEQWRAEREGATDSGWRPEHN